jgi:hypothetical protein
VADYVQIEKLDFDTVEDEGGMRRAGTPPPDENGRPHVTFHKNDFPYNFDRGMQHHNIWCTRPLSDEEIAEVIRQHRAGWEVLFFRNPESLASIPSVWHGMSCRGRDGRSDDLRHVASAYSELTSIVQSATLYSDTLYIQLPIASFARAELELVYTISSRHAIG